MSGTVFGQTVGNSVFDTALMDRENTEGATDLQGLLQVRENLHRSYSQFDAVREQEQGVENEAVLEAAKTVLTNKLDYLTAYIDRLAVRIDEALIIGSDEKRAINILADAYKVQAGQYKSEINSAESMEELREIATTVKTRSRDQLLAMRALALVLNASKGNSVIEKLNENIGRVELQLDAAQAAGHDVSALRDRLALLKQSLREVQMLYIETLSQVKELTTSQNTIQLMDQAHNKIVDANTALRQVNSDFNQIFQELHGLYLSAPWEL